MLVIVSARTVGSGSPTSARSASGESVGGAASPGGGDRCGEGRLGAVNRLQPPVGVDDDDPAAWSGDADELGHGGVGLGEVLEDAFPQRGVVAGVVEVEAP